MSAATNVYRFGEHDYVRYIEYVGLEETLTALRARNEKLEKVAVGARNLYRDYCEPYPKAQRELRDELFAALADLEGE